MKEIIPKESPYIRNNVFTRELALAVIVALLCSLAGTANLLFASNDLYPFTSDAMGHMAKIKYISECLSQWKIPSWFPAWYNGATVTQYYVPLSYYLMVPFWWATKNIMLCYKIYCISMMFIGGMGVWTFCYKKIGRWCGLVGIIAFCLQSFLTESLYIAGVVAQAPIFALMPWFLLIILECAQKPTRRNFLMCTLLSVLLILSHAMHAFMVCACTLFVLFILVILKKVSLTNIFITSASIGFAGVLTAFWSVVGATGLENPGIPYLLPEASLFYTATLDWFLGVSSAVYDYSIPISIMSILSIIIFAFSSYKKQTTDTQTYYCLSAILLTIFTTIFSFGMHLPLYKFLPMSTSMVPGRILSYTAVTAAIACAYVIYAIWNLNKFKTFNKILAFAIVLTLIVSMNPYKNVFETRSSDNFDSMANKYLDTQSSAFNKGRYEWIGAVYSSETYLPLQYNFNTSDGWNIEGTLHNKAIWNFNIAFATKKYDYVVKQLAYWNVRYLLLSKNYSDIRDNLANYMQFKEIPDVRDNFSLYVSKNPSSYFYKDSRNAIAIGSGSSEISLAFPYITHGSKPSISDYTFEELKNYKLIYICEPKIDTIAQKENLEYLVRCLSDNGSTVIIEPVASKNHSIFDVNTIDEPVEKTPIMEITQDCPWKLENTKYINNNGIGTIRSLFGLDNIYAAFVQKGGRIQNAVLGTKKVGNGNVIFLGAHLSQYLETVNVKNLGLKENDHITINNSKIVTGIYEKIFDSSGVNKTFMPEQFHVTGSTWDYQGGYFTYDNAKPQKVTVSVTYAPRWSADLDGKEIKIGECENLITLDLPAGKHKVNLHYGITIYGMIGYIISCVGLVLFTLFIIFFGRIQKLINKLGKLTKNYLQL